MWKNKLYRQIISAALMMISFSVVTAQTQMSDTGFVRKNIHDNMHEVRMAELAIEKDVQQDIKNVAITIRDDHKLMLNDIANFAKENNMTAITESEMNISTDTVGLGNATSANKGVMTRNRRDDAQSVDESRNTRKKGKATQRADAGKPSGDRRGTGFDNSREKQANADTGNVSQGNQSMNEQDAQQMHSEQMGNMQQLTGKAFESSWVQQMISMHEKKLAELQSASKSLTNEGLKQLATKAIPKIEKHLELLRKVKAKA